MLANIHLIRHLPNMMYVKICFKCKNAMDSKNTPHPCGRAKFPHHEMSISPRGEICFVNLGQKWGHYYRKIIKFAF